MCVCSPDRPMGVAGDDDNMLLTVVVGVGSGFGIEGYIGSQHSRSGNSLA